MVNDDDEVKPMKMMMVEVEVMGKNMFAVVVLVVVHWNKEILVVVVV
jgi:hypothetical protein